VTRSEVSNLDSLAAELITIRDLFRYAVSHFGAARLVYGHGTTNAEDEAAFIVLEALHLPPASLQSMLDARLLFHERRRVLGMIEMRVNTRKPAAYLVHKSYIRGVPFYVDERAIVPRSFIGHMLQSEVVCGQVGALIVNPSQVHRVLDLCTGSGCLAILAASRFPHAYIDAVDLSGDALAVAEINVRESGLADRIRLLEGDLFAPLAGEHYDLILSNPPYVSAADMAALPEEYRCEPSMALAGGADGLDFVRRILRAAPAHLTGNGGLLCEIGAGREQLEAEFPRVSFCWLESDAVFWVERP
jgi:ribosomal protein L3 glutamine methyltransferase